YPPKIDDKTADEYIFPLRSDIARLIPLKVAALVSAEEKRELSQGLSLLYEREVARIKADGGSMERYIKSFYSI
ncbi:MAG: hypothetical protein RR396_07215, partial [Clostridiales bacterium]